MMLFWISSSQCDDTRNVLFMQGISFGDGYGFGENTDTAVKGFQFAENTEPITKPTFKRSFEGVMFVIDGRSQSRLSLKGKVGIRHRARIGFDQYLDSVELPVCEIPRPPFLLTSQEDLKLIYHGQVRIRLCEGAQEGAPDIIEEPIGVKVQDGDLIGVLETGTFERPAKVNALLTLFGTQDHTPNSIRGLRILFEECGEELGVIEEYSSVV